MKIERSRCVDEHGSAPAGDCTYEVEDDETPEISTENASLDDYSDSLAALGKYGEKPDPSEQGVWVPGVPGIMASRTIKNERDRRMTIMTTTFIHCGAKFPFIAMIAGALSGGSALVSTSSYFIGMAAIIVSGVMLKMTRMFAGDPAPFVMELPGYHMPTVLNVLRSMWERGWPLIKKAGTVILLSFIIWFDLLCAPCFAAIKREMNITKWIWFAVGYQCVFAYVISLIYQFGLLFTGATAGLEILWLIAAFVLLAGMVYMLFLTKYQEATKLEKNVEAI